MIISNHLKKGDRVLAFSTKLLLINSVVLLSSIKPTVAQIVPDSSLGAENSVVTPNQTINDLPSTLIDGGAVRDTNLFHSFQLFNVPDGQGVYFSNPINIENILTRVTGSEASNILGTLGVQGDANLFLVNPNGIFFGPNARLDVNGSFVSTTADSIVFSDETQFSRDSSVATLTISTPLGLQFGTNNGDINLEGSVLSMSENSTLALIGGRLSFRDGLVLSDRGTIELAGIGDNSFVSFSDSASGLTFDYAMVNSFRDIRLSEGSEVEVVGINGGDLNVSGRNIRLAGGAGFESFTFGTESRGNLTVRAAESLELSGQEEGALVSRITAQVQSGTTGAGSNINIEAGTLRVRDNAIIDASTFGNGDAGNIAINASESIQVSEIGVSSLVREGAIGNGGNIDISTQRLVVEDEGQISTSTFGTGNAGSIDIRASESINVVGVERLTFDGFDGNTAVFIRDFLGSTITARAEEGSVGNSGSLNITTGNLNLENGGQISVSNLSEGNAGFLSIDAREVRLEIGSSIFAQTTSGDGGNIIIRAQDLVLMRGSSIISTEAGTAPGGGDGGNILIDTRFLAATPLDNNRIIANAFLGNGGNIVINGEAVFGFEIGEGGASNSFISASSRFGTSGGVLITAPRVEFSREFNETQASAPRVEGLVELGCSSNNSSGTGSFTIRGNTDIPTNPVEIFEEDSNSEEESGSVSDNLIVEASGWILDDSGEGLLHLISHDSISANLGTLTTCYRP